MTYKERVYQTVSEKSLCGCMNDTKWRELQQSVGSLPFPPPYVLKSVLEEETPAHAMDQDVPYWGSWSDESLLFGQFFAIEWLKVRPRYQKREGVLLPYTLVDETKEFVALLHQHNIPYQQNNGTYTLYGYK